MAIPLGWVEDLRPSPDGRYLAFLRGSLRGQCHNAQRLLSIACGHEVRLASTGKASQSAERAKTGVY